MSSPPVAEAPARSRRHARESLLPAALRPVAFGYALQLLALVAFALASSVSPAIVAGFVGLVAVHAGIAGLMEARPGLRHAVARRVAAVPDPLAVHLVAAAAVQLLFLALVPALGGLFVAGLLLALLLSAMRLARVVVLSLAAAALLMLALVLATVDAWPSLPQHDDAVRAAVWFTIALLAAAVLALGNEAMGLRRRLLEREHELEAMLAKSTQLAGIDELTQVPNRRSILGVLDEARERSSRYGAPLCVAMLDLDHFKSINDRFGHPVGDAVLRRFADIVGHLVRATDHIGRMGGEEFLLVLGETGELPARRALERLRTAVAEHPWNELAGGLQVTVSAGLAEYRPGESVGTLLERADQALYDAKRAGRNCVRMH